jgi:hypothetical protein
MWATDRLELAAQAAMRKRYHNIRKGLMKLVWGMKRFQLEGTATGGFLAQAGLAEKCQEFSSTFNVEVVAS